MDTRRGIYSIALMALLATWGGRAEAQLLFKPGEPYVNYAFEGYRAYESLIFGRDRTPQFDNLGQFVMNGVSVFELREFRTIDPVSGSIITKPNLYQGYLNRLVIADDSYAGVNTKLIIGDRVRAKFTPLTLDLAAMNGLRMDTRFNKGSLVLLASRIDKPIFEAVQNADNNIHGDENSEFRPRWSTYLLGGDLRTQLPGVDMGISWVNQYRTDSFKSLDQSSYKGTLPTTGRPPEWIVVRVADQNPNDAVGVRVRRAVLSLNGRPLQHVLGPHSVADDQTLALTVTEHQERPPIPPARRDNSNDLVIEFPHVDPSPQGVYETRGRGALLFWFKVPAYFFDAGDTTIVDRSAVALDVSGDYQIDLAEVFDGASANPATYFYTAETATGRPSDLDDYRRVRVRYGRQTGRTLLGAHANIDIKGFMLRTEYVRNFSFRAYPALISTELKHRTEQTGAFFAVLKRKWKRLSLGGELFSIDRDYSTALNVQDDDFRSYFQFLSSPFIYPTNFNEPQLPDLIEGERPGPTNTIEFNSVDDNDDKDQYPDSYFLRKTTNLTTGGRFIEDPNGVFPGLDSDQNGRPDINENDNRIPDYYEPFLLYRVNPDAYDYGEDMNNNGVIDEREDDDKPDYPYDVDRRGIHGFGQMDMLPGGTLTLGYHHSRAPAEGGRANSTYARFEYQHRIPFWAEIYGVERLKWVQDDIADVVFGLGRNPIYLEPEPVPLFAPTDEQRRNPLGLAVLQDDPLLMRDSRVHTLYLRAKLVRYEYLHAVWSLKHESNNQRRTPLQPKNTIGDFAMVFKTDYEWTPWRGLRVRPQLKWLRQRLSDDRGQVVEVHERYFYPILRLEYPISPRTSIKLGAQGFPFLASTYRNEVSPDVDFDDRAYLAQVSNTSTYLGYQVNVNLGYERRLREFKNRDRRAQDIDYSRIFLRVIAGLRPLF